MKKILLIIGVMLLCCGCNKETSSNQSSAETMKASEEEVMDSSSILMTDSKQLHDTSSLIYHQYTRKTDGTWEAEGNKYKYCLLLERKIKSTGISDCRKYIVLSNDETVSYDDAASLSLLSSVHSRLDPLNVLLVEEMHGGGYEAMKNKDK